MKQDVLNQIKWYFSVRKIFDFDGKPYEEIESHPSGCTGFKAFYIVDTHGRKKIPVTRHPNIYKSLMKTKGSVNLHIKMYAEDRAKGILPRIEFDEICKQINAPSWFIEAVENQKWKYYGKE